MIEFLLTYNPSLAGFEEIFSNAFFDVRVMDPSQRIDCPHRPSQLSYVLTPPSDERILCLM